MRRNLTNAQRIAESFILGYESTRARVSTALNALEKAFGMRDGIAASLETFSITGANKDKMTQAVTMADDAIDQIYERLPDLGITYALVDEFLTELTEKDHDAGIALRLYYLNRESYDTIAREINVSQASVYRILDRGLDEAFQMLSEETDRWLS